MFIKRNNQEKIKTIFYTKEQIIKEYWFKITSTIKEIFNYFERHIKEEGYSLKSNYKIFGKKINELYTISELIKKERNDTVLDGEIWIEVDEESIFDDENDETFYTILQPKLNPFELIEYNTLKSKIKIIKCPQDIYQYCNLNKFTKESGFCNSINSLYISGGEILGKAINNFWIINKNNYKISKKNMPINKKYHSMLYIPDNFIFIVGGDTLKTIIYDIENQEFINWANMNKNHFQPGLCIYGDYIYAFSALNDINKNMNYFEKTNLTSKNPKWEIIFPIFENNIKMNSFFFGVSKFSNGNLLFIGGEKNNPSYIFNPDDNKITISNGKNLSIPFWDRTFYKINRKYNICIPLNFCTSKKIAFFDKENESLEQVQYDENKGFINFNIEKKNEPGNIFIKSTIKNKKTNQNIKIQIGLNPKNLFKKSKNKYNYEYLSYTKNNTLDNQSQNHNNEKKKDKHNSEFNDEIINISYNNKEKDAKPISYYKNYSKSNYLYIPDTYVEDQIFYKQFDSNDNLDTKMKYYKKIYENDKNYFDENIDKEKVIIFSDLDRNNIPLTKNRFPCHKPYFYISNSVIYDQIINRELII